MDRQIRAERAWAIPYFVGETINRFDFAAYESFSLKTLLQIFERNHLHRFNEKMAGIFFKGIERIRDKYEGNAGNIWSGKPRCALVIRRFLEFDGAGIKIATMATNLLFRQFRIEMVEPSSIDISPDIQAMKFFKDQGLLRRDAEISELIYLARELSPNYPGLLDLLAWEKGRLIKTTKNTLT